MFHIRAPFVCSAIRSAFVVCCDGDGLATSYPDFQDLLAAVKTIGTNQTAAQEQLVKQMARLDSVDKKQK